MLLRELAAAERGEDPKGVVRDAAANDIIEYAMERSKHHYSDGFESIARRTRIRYSPIVEDLIRVFTQERSQRMRRTDLLRTIGATAGGLALGRPVAATAQPALEKIRIAGPLTEDLVGVYYGIQTGLFSRAGLSIELIGTQNGAAATEAVVTGTYELAKAAVNVGHCRALARNSNADRRATSGLHFAEPVLFCWKSLPTRRSRPAADLNGKTLGIPSLNSISELAVRAWMDKKTAAIGARQSSSKFRTRPNPLRWADHRIDAAMLQVPQLDATLNSGATRTVGDAYGAIAPVFMIAGFVARADWAAAHRDTLRPIQTLLTRKLQRT